MLVALSFSTSILAVECSAVFPDGVQNNSNSGDITFNNGAKVVNSPDNILASKNSIIDLSGGVSCDTTTCTSSGSIASAVNYNNFPNSNTDVFVDEFDSLTISPGNYKNITLSTLATLNVEPGDYTFSGSMNLVYLSKINIVGSGVVRFFIKNTVSVNTLASINDNGEASNFLLYAKKDIDIYSGGSATAFIYSEKDIEVQAYSSINGAISGKNVLLYSPSTVTFDDNVPDFGDYCEGASSIDLIAQWHFDELSWGGSENEVLDSSGNDLHLTAVSAQIGTVDPAITGNPGTCHYGLFNGDVSFIQRSDSTNSLLDIEDNLTVTAWIKSNIAGSSQIKTILSKDTNYEFHLADNNEIYWWWNGDGAPRSITTTDANISPNQWHHIAITYTSETQVLYVDGEIKGTASYDGSLPTNNAPLQIGKDINFSSRNFDGAIDEVRIYASFLSQSQVVDVMNETHPCVNYLPDHFVISHDGSGLNCQPESINIKACSDANCDNLFTANVDVELSVNGSVEQTVTVIGGSSDSSFSYTDVGTATLSLDQTFACENGASSSCDVEFAATGFRFYSDTETNPIPTQLSAKPSNIGFNASTLKIQAIKTNPDSGACEAVLTDAVNIELAATCINPTTCLVDNNVQFNEPITDTSTEINTLDDDASLVYTPVALDFGANTDNAAEFIFTYPEAGQMQLHARYNLPDVNGDPSGNYIEGSSNNFVVRPLGFLIEVPANPNFVDGTTSDERTLFGDVDNIGVIRAGEAFTLNLHAKQWAAGDDEDNDGIADSHDADDDGRPDDDADADGDGDFDQNVLIDNNNTLNFGNEISPLTVDISVLKYKPNFSNKGDLNNSQLTGFVNGTATREDLSYSEVGLIHLSANITGYSYLGSDDITGDLIHVGRFSPAHFYLEKVDDGILIGTCESTNGVLPFAYVGQKLLDDTDTGAIRYGINPSFTITAQNATGQTTQNYRGNFNKLSIEGVSKLTPLTDVTETGLDSNKLKLTAELNDGSLLEAVEPNGVLTYQFSDDDHFFYNHEGNSEVGAFLSDINLEITSVIDSDGVEAKDANDTEDETISGVLTLDPAGIEIRFGRATLANSFGPETSTLPQLLSLEYLDTNGNYVLAADDSCTPYNSSNISFDFTGQTLTADDIDANNITAATGNFDDINDASDGQTRAIQLPTAANQGSVRVIYNIADWLKYDWAYDEDGIDGAFDDNPSAIASFGIYRGNDRIIYYREVN